MDGRLAGDEEDAGLKRIADLLRALADLAELAATRCMAVRCFVLWLLLAAEAVARSLVTSAPAPCPFHHAGASRADARRLARRFRNLARALDRLASADAGEEGAGEFEPAWRNLRRVLRLAASPCLMPSLALPGSMRTALRVVAVPDTS